MTLDSLEQQHLDEYEKLRSELGQYGFLTGDCDRDPKEVAQQHAIGYRCEVLDGLIKKLKQKKNESE